MDDDTAQISIAIARDINTESSHECSGSWGSNSLLRGGYVASAMATLSRNVSTAVEARNLSVGGTTTITAISRLFDLPSDYAPDLILYEYALNDGGHFKARQHGAEIQTFVIRLLIETLAGKFPDAMFAPILLGMKPFFGPALQNPIYLLQSKIWADAKIPYLDVRRRLAYLFANASPDWLYEDIAHYSIPHGADIVGAMVGRFLVEIAHSGPKSTVRDLNSRLRAVHGALPWAVRAVKAEELAELASGDRELVVRTNRLMSVPALRIYPGAKLRLAPRLLNLSLLSDRRHDVVRFSFCRDPRPLTVELGTRFIAVDNPVINPPEVDRFFYSGIAIPFLSLRAGLDFENTPFEIEVPVALDESSTRVAFDSFVRLPPLVEARYLDLVSCLNMEQRPTVQANPNSVIGAQQEP